MSLVDASQMLVSSESGRDNNSDFLPSHFLSRRRYDGVHNIGDITIRYQSLTSGSQSTCLDFATRRGDKVPVEGSDGDVLFAADMTATLPWHSPASFEVLNFNATYSVGLRFILAASVPGVEDTVVGDGMPFAERVPGYTIPMDSEAILTLRHKSSAVSTDTKTACTVRTLSSHHNASTYSLSLARSV